MGLLDGRVSPECLFRGNRWPLLTTSSRCCTTCPPGFTKLADKYLSLDDMRISDSSSLQTQTIEQEFQAYITAPVCAEGTDIVKYWEVRHCVDE
jgi:hypothetical protein